MVGRLPVLCSATGPELRASWTISRVRIPPSPPPTPRPGRLVFGEALLVTRLADNVGDSQIAVLPCLACPQPPLQGAHLTLAHGLADRFEGNTRRDRSVF